MNNFCKKVTQPVTKQYSPVALVKAHEDKWSYWADDLSAETRLALHDKTPDAKEAFNMELMEKGVIGRINVFDLLQN